MRYSIFLIFCLASWHCLPAQAPKAPVGKATFQALASETYNPVPYAQSISAADMEAKMNVLCSDSLRGRETGDIGQVLAGRYIAGSFERMGLEKKGDSNSFYQYFTLANSRFEQTQVRLGKVSQRLKTDWYAYPKNTPEGKVKAKRISVLAPDATSMTRVKRRVLLTYASRQDDEFVAEASRKGAKAVLFIDTKFKEHLRNNRRSIDGYGWQPIFPKKTKTKQIPVLYISEQAAKVFLGADFERVEKALLTSRHTFKPFRLKKRLEFHIKKREKIMQGSNVFAYLEGSDPKLKDEIIAITAHYDHLGEAGGVIYYGADDNASGTAGVMEIAEAFAAAKKAGNGPKRSLVFMLVSGEEKGLLGSKFYTDYPIFPLKNTITNLNTDMIGRIDAAHKDNPNYIYVIGSDRLSQELHTVNEAVNARYAQMELDYTFNAENDPNHFYERSDHYNFAKNDVPCIFYFNGVHADYHKPSDTIEKIDFDLAAKRTQLTFYTAWELAHRATRPALDK